MVRPKKKLGQHFLTDNNIAQKIVNALEYSEGKTVLEIGPGTGVLTHWLRQQSATVYHVEIDSESIEYLKEQCPQIVDYLIEGDFLKMDLTRLSPLPLSIIGNFPYNISSQIFFKILDNVEKVEEVVCMIQYEVAQRISSAPGSKQYGILSVLLQAWFDIEFLFKVPPQVFNPPPKVDSGIIRLKRKENYAAVLDCDAILFKRVVKTAFNQRRKMLGNSLKALLGDEKIEKELMKKRPEQLSVKDFVYLTREISKVLTK